MAKKKGTRNYTKDAVRPAPAETEETIASAGGLKAVLPEVQDEESRAARGFRTDYHQPKGEGEPEVEGAADSAPLPELGKPEVAPGGEPEPAQKNPGAHRLNPNKNATLQPIDELRSESEGSISEWRDGMERNDLGAEPEEVRQGKFRRLVLVGLILIAAATFLVYKFGVGGNTVNEPLPRDPGVVAFEVEQELIAEATAVLEKYLAEDDLLKKFSYTRESEDRIRDMERYYRDHPQEFGIEVVGEPSAVQQFSREGQDFLGLVFDFSDVSRRGVIFEITEDGLKFDWRSFVGYSDMSISEFLEVEPLEPMLMRVILNEDDYYNFAYADHTKWVCVRVENATRKLAFWAYCPRESETHRALVAGEKELAAKRINIFEAVIQVRFDEAGRGKRQAILEEFVAAGHLVP